MLNPGVPKCNEDLITLEIYVEQGKTMNYKVFIYMPQCENINIFGYLGASIIRLKHYSYHSRQKQITPWCYLFLLAIIHISLWPCLDKTVHFQWHLVINHITRFLTPPAEWQQSFSNAELSVGVNFFFFINFSKTAW